METKTEKEKSIVEQTSVNELIPLASLGGIRLGDPIEIYSNRLDFELVYSKIPSYTSYYWYQFKNGDINAHTTNGFITYISCDNNVTWNGHMVIGMKISEFIKRFHLSVDSKSFDYIPIADKNHYSQYMYTFCELPTLTVWTWRKRIEKIMISNEFFDDE